LTSSPTTAQIQNLQHTAMKIGLASAGIGIGITVISFVAHHHHKSARTQKTEGFKSVAGQFARASHRAEAGFTNAPAGGAEPNSAISMPEVKAANLSGNSLFQSQAGLWTWQQIVGTPR
jgi:hypothetical protein